MRNKFKVVFENEVYVKFEDLNGVPLIMIKKGNYDHSLIMRMGGAACVKSDITPNGGVFFAEALTTVLSETEMLAVLFHEVGHYHNGDLNKDSSNSVKVDTASVIRVDERPADDYAAKQTSYMSLAKGVCKAMMLLSKSSTKNTFESTTMFVSMIAQQPTRTLNLLRGVVLETVFA